MKMEKELIEACTVETDDKVYECQSVDDAFKLIALLIAIEFLKEQK